TTPTRLALITAVAPPDCPTTRLALLVMFPHYHWVEGRKVEGRKSFLARRWLAANQRSQTATALTAETFDLRLSDLRPNDSGGT
ncbi:MAG: hypothetical protein ACTHMU_24740, partial [Thermomicrobiales bacterium]